MQHPVGVKLVDGRPQLVDIWAVLTNNTALAAYSHTLVGSLSVAGAFLLGISWYHLWRRRHDGIDTVGADRRVVVGSAPGIRGRDAPTTGSGSARCASARSSRSSDSPASPSPVTRRRS